MLSAARFGATRIDISLQAAARARAEGESAKREREAALVSLRTRMRDLASELDRLKDTVHRDEVARAEQRMRIEALQDKVMEDFGIEPDVLVGEYGPEQEVPPSQRAVGDDLPDAAEVRDRLQAMAATQAVSIEEPGATEAPMGGTPAVADVLTAEHAEPAAAPDAPA